MFKELDEKPFFKAERVVKKVDNNQSRQQTHQNATDNLKSEPP